MNRLLFIARAISFIVIFVAILVMVGWFMDIGALKSIYPTWVTMKFTTATSFLFCSIITFLISFYIRSENDFIQILLSVLSSFVLLLMATLLISNLFGIRTGLEDLFVREAPGTVNTPVPGRPSVMTMLNFVLLAFSGLVTLIYPVKLTLWLSRIGFLVFIIGLIAFVGYIINIPALYYVLPGFSSAMAIHTAMLFILLGIQLILFRKIFGVSRLKN